MALDAKEVKNIVPGAAAEFPSQAETLSTAPEVNSTPERPSLESGDVVESGRMAGGSERLARPDMIPSSAAYSPATDPAYQAYKQIEDVLAEDLGEIYNNLTPKEQKAFKIKGEETARSVFQLVYHQTKVKVKKILKLIRNWLKVIPGMNKFFLEQEAKIKTDKIIALAKDDKKIEF